MQRREYAATTPQHSRSRWPPLPCDLVRVVPAHAAAVRLTTEARCYEDLPLMQTRPARPVPQEATRLCGDRESPGYVLRSRPGISPGSIAMMLTPVSPSPDSIARCTGAAPRHRGKATRGH